MRTKQYFIIECAAAGCVSAARPPALAELARRAAAGDGAALDGLLRAVQDRVERYLAGRLAARPDGHDLAGDLRQEVLIRAAGAVGRCRFESDARLVAWVLTIARRVLVDHVRAERARREVLPDRALELMAEEASLARWRGGAHELGPGELLETLAARALGALPERTRELLRLRVQLGWTWKEVGRALGTTEAGAKRRYQRAQAALRTRFLALLDALPPAERDTLPRALKDPSGAP